MADRAVRRGFVTYGGAASGKVAFGKTIEMILLQGKAFMTLHKNMIRALIVTWALLLASQAQADCNQDIQISKPNNLYIDHENGTVTDKETGLMWMKCSVGQSGASCDSGSATLMSWKSALESAQAANSANNGAGTFGYTDWRVPNIKELGSLVEAACFNPSINVSVFPGIVNEAYWSASPFGPDSIGAWFVSFSAGSIFAQTKDINFLVRLVRGAQ